MFAKLGSSIALQSMGTVASFSVIWLITNFYGIEKQGEFAILKSWVDFLVVMFCFGMPQSIIYSINKLNTSTKEIQKFSIIYSFFVFLIATLIFSYKYKNLEIVNSIEVVGLGMSIGFLVGFYLFRGIFLTRNDGKIFAFITALPAVSLFLITLLNVISNKDLFMEKNYLVSTCIPYFIMIYLLCNSKKNGRENIDWSVLIRNGTSVFFQALSITLLPVITYWLMGDYGMSKSAIGGFNISIYIYQAFVLPLNMIAPIFYNKWSQLNSDSLIKKDLFKLLRFGLLIIPLSLVINFVANQLAPLIFGQQIKFALPSIHILLMSAFPLFVINLLTCVLLSKGFFKQNSVVYIFKTLCCSFFMYMVLRFGSESSKLELVAFSWLLSDIIVLIVLSFIVNKKFRAA